jgi:hypothetical protein
VVALACNLDLPGTRFLAGLTAVFVVCLHQALAWQVPTLLLVNRRHRASPLSSSFPKVRQDSVYSQYQAFASRKLVRIDRPAESAPAVTEITPEHEATETPFFVKVSVCAQRRWSKMSDSSFLGTSRKKELPCRLDFTQLGSPSCSAASFMARI